MIEQPTSFLDTLIRGSRKLELDYEQASHGASESAARVRAAVAKFLDGYAAFNQISPEAAAASYMATVRSYANDIKLFVQTGKYPLQIDPAQPMLSRLDYDLFLILTILVTKHRCAIMEELMEFTATGKALVIGVGSGVELGFVGAPGGGDAYDLYINPYARQAFPGWNLREELYRPTPGRLHDAVYAIELLEHLDDPYAFLKDCRDSLAPGGRAIVTTATNVPQFDHRYNFVSDEEFERRAADLGLRLEHKRVIPHDYARTQIVARNAFYVFST